MNQLLTPGNSASSESNARRSGKERAGPLERPATFKVLDLFSGIGAYSLGLERTGGFETVAFCERDPYCQKILKKHWPDVPIYDDVQTLTGDRLRADGIAADFIVAGWPCQDISVAGTGRGLDGERSGLWPHIARIAGEIQARGLLLENSSNLLAINEGRDFGRVLGDLAALGLNVEWHCLSAAAFDAPHIRDRLWIVGLDADAMRQGLEGLRSAGGVGTQFARPDQLRQAAADSDNSRQQQSQGRGTEKRRRIGDCGSQLDADADIIAPIGASIARRQRHTWEPESGLARVVSGASNRVDRIRAIGNTNPPIIPETLGRAILETAAIFERPAP